jgi:hypothetical protein
MLRNYVLPTLPPHHRARSFFNIATPFWFLGFICTDLS